MRTLYYHADVYTGELPLVQAFIVENDRFVFVGSEKDAREFPVDDTVDLDGAFVCAGFTDSHMHVLNLGNALTMAPLAEHTDTLEDMLCCLRETAPVGGWILGRGWNQDLFQDVHRMPNRWDLDRVSLEYPVCATRACGHALVVNSKALTMLGITADTPQIEGGEIVMEAGEPTGLFLDNARSLVREHLPIPTIEEVKGMLRNACRLLNTYGITSCHTDDYGAFRGLPWQIVNAAYRELEASGELTVRIYKQANLKTTEALSEFLRAGNGTGIGTPMFRIGPLKMLGDGALGSRSAFLSVPYADAPETRGLSVFTPEEFDAMIDLANRNGMQVAIHAIGDACLDLVLNSIEKALAAYPREDHRHGIVHCQITRPDQLERIIKNKLHVYAQSIFLDYDIHIVGQRVGNVLAVSSYNWKTLMDGGVSVSNGSDCPVELPDVMAGMQCAVTRCDRAGNGPYLPEQAFTVQEALDSFTSVGARASFEEHEKGKMQSGMLADFVVLQENPFQTAPNKIQEIPVLKTYLGGKLVLEKVN